MLLLALVTHFILNCLDMQPETFGRVTNQLKHFNVGQLLGEHLRGFKAGHRLIQVSQRSPVQFSLVTPTVVVSQLVRGRGRHTQSRVWIRQVSPWEQIFGEDNLAVFFASLLISDNSEPSSRTGLIPDIDCLIEAEERCRGAAYLRFAQGRYVSPAE